MARRVSSTYVVDVNTNHRDVFGVPSRLRQLRGEMSQTEFARRTGIKQSAYSNYERGAREISLSTAHRIAQALSVDLAWLLVGVPSEAMLRSLSVADSVRDPRLAKMMVWLATQWDAHNEHGRTSLRRRFEAAFPECREAPAGESSD